MKSKEIFTTQDIVEIKRCPNCGAKMDVTDINVGNKGGDST